MSLHFLPSHVLQVNQRFKVVNLSPGKRTWILAFEVDAMLRISSLFMASPVILSLASNIFSVQVMILASYSALGMKIPSPRIVDSGM